MQIKPFFINSNICMEENDISSYKKFMTAISGNTGNSYITYALIKELFGGLIKIRHIQNIYEYDFKNSAADIDYINNQATHVFLILQDQIRIAESYGLKLPYKEIMDFISKINKPVIIAGLGANSFNGFDPDFHKKLDPNLITFLKFLSEHCLEIGIRGTFTQEVLHKIGIDNTRVIGCPSFFETGRNRQVVKQEIKDFNQVLFTQRIPLYTPGNHKIMQDFQEEAIIKPIAFDMLDREIFSQRLAPILGQTYHIFSDIAGWKDFVKNFKFAIGFRVHGSILSLNSGVPAVCLNVDSRAAEMCNFLKIPHIPGVKIRSKKGILKIYENLDLTELNKNYPQLFDNFIDFLHANNLRHYTENEEIHGALQYVKQPVLKLYSPAICKELNKTTFKLKHFFICTSIYIPKIIKKWKSSIKKRLRLLKGKI